MQKLIKIKFQNGITKEAACREILKELASEYIFEECDDPDFILFGPYGNDIPGPGDYIRIGYFCENIKPDMSICEWAFGIPYESQVNDLRYRRIQWHNLDPRSLVKAADYDAKRLLSEKRHFCNFVYSHRVPYREYFFKELSKYKRIDAPGKSMNNMGSFDQGFTGDMWERKRQFISHYKFTIAFENDIYPGYQTEKIYDAMLADSLPIYCGDPLIGKVFNKNSFINLVENDSGLITWLENIVEADFTDMRPQFYHNIYQRVKRKLKAVGRDVKMELRLKKRDIDEAIEKIIMLDRDDTLYIQTLNEPWFTKNALLPALSIKNRWIEIFNGGS